MKSKIILGFVLVLLALGLVSSAENTNGGFSQSTTNSFPQSSGGSFTQGAYSSSYSSSSYQRSSTGSFYTSEQISQYWPILSKDEKESCEARQDILINVAPAGCQPTVVRSDLLAEQNVPVFCQLDALTLNPFIDIKQIRNIRFSGKYPEGVVGVGFHPARAALNSRDMLLGDPVINNIGYVVVLLKKQPVESKLPDFINFTLTAHIDYYSGNAFGVGKSEFSLNQMSDAEWEDKSKRDSFYKGNYYVRLEESDPNRAVVSLYSGERKISTTSVEKGKESRIIYLPGLYCQAGVKVAYDGYVGNADSARIEIIGSDGTDTLDVYKGSDFLNDGCTVSKLQITDKAEGTGKLDLSCQGKKVSLEIREKNEDGQLSNVQLDSGVKKEYDEAISSYIDVSEIYPFDKGINSEIAKPYGQQALEEALELAGKAGQDSQRSEILKQIIDKYSFERSYFEGELARYYKYDLKDSIKNVQVDNRYYAVRVVKFNSVSDEEKSKVTFSINGNSKDFTEGLVGNVGGSSSVKSIAIERVYGPERVRASVNCNSGTRGGGSFTFNIEDDARTVCGDSIIKLENIDLEGVAKIRLVPRADGTKTQTNFTVGVGIEKRAIQLSPEKALEKAKNLNESIQKWEAISKRLANVVSGMKAACFATSAVLTVKNFVSGLDGTALARQETMQGQYGWSQICKDAVANKYLDLNFNGQQDNGEKSVTYGSVTQCFNEEKPNIEKEINARKQSITSSNDLIKGVESSNGVTTQGGLLGDNTVNVQEARKILCERLKTKEGFVTTFGKDGNVDCNDKDFPASYNDLRDWAYQKDLESQGVASAKKEVDRISASVTEYKALIERNKANKENKDLLNSFISNLGSQKAKPFSAEIWKVEQKDNSKSIGEFTLSGTTTLSVEETHAVLIEGRTGEPTTTSSTTNTPVTASKNGYYLVTGKLAPDNTLTVSKVYPVEVDGGKKEIKVSGAVSEESGLFLRNKADIQSIKSLSSKVDGNPILRDQDRKVRFFGSGPDKDMPAYVPFDLTEGWYVYVQSGIGENKAYDSSGLPKNWIIANVGANGAVDYSGDDQQVINRGQFTNVLGLDDSKSQKLIRDSQNALMDAARQKGNKVMRINGFELGQGSDVSHLNSQECQNFMSIDDCKLLFNMCDPVICPASRCNLGGEYQVADVIQTGIVGSAVLCLPNAKEGVLIPVCLTGIQAGIDSYVSILKNYRDCLTENVETGQMVGICDTIYSIYTCEFFWNQVAPVVNILLPKLIQYAYGGGNAGARGGGEYLTVMGAWENTQNSINYFKQEYAVNSLKAFNIRSASEAGTQFCKAFISAKGPNSFKTLIEPDSPPQFYAWFSSSKFNDATVPATARYKVFFHIYAGKDSGVTYSVYLKNPPQSTLYFQNERVSVKTGFITKGQYASETVDFTAPEGYSELCVRVNDKEECGFKQVTTDFAVNYVTDELVKDEITNNQIKTAQECISGGTSALQLIQPNVQDAAQDALNPDINDRGIVRICSTRNPGASTEPTRYQEVGFCGDNNLKCWLDKKSVDNAITDANKGARKETISELEEQASVIKAEQGNFLGEEAVESIKNARDKVNSLVKSYNSKNQLNQDEINKVRTELNAEFGILEEKLLLAHHKAEVAFLKARLEGLEARAAVEKANIVKQETDKAATEKSAITAPATTSNEKQEGVISLELNYDPAKKIYLLMDGIKTDIYLQGNKVVVDLFPFDKQIGTIENNKVGLLSSAESYFERIYKGLYNRMNGAKLDGAKVIFSDAVLPTNSKGITPNMVEYHFEETKDQIKFYNVDSSAEINERGYELFYDGKLRTIYALKLGSPTLIYVSIINDDKQNSFVSVGKIRSDKVIEINTNELKKYGCANGMDVEPKLLKTDGDCEILYNLDGQFFKLEEVSTKPLDTKVCKVVFNEVDSSNVRKEILSSSTLNIDNAKSYDINLVDCNGNTLFIRPSFSDFSGKQIFSYKSSLSSDTFRIISENSGKFRIEDRDSMVDGGEEYKFHDIQSGDLKIEVYGQDGRTVIFTYNLKIFKA